MRATKLLTVTMVSFFLTASLVFAGQLTKVSGWNGSGTYFSGLDGEQGTATDIDINGEVGHPVYVSSPTASCGDFNHWDMDAEIVSGALPPGLELGGRGSGYYGTIKGIPTKRGHWIVNMRTYNLTCEGANFMGFTQQLRFHITGTGEVIQ